LLSEAITCVFLFDGDVVLKRFKRTKDVGLLSGTDSKTYNHTILEQLEPRIMLSGEGLLSVDTPDSFTDCTQPVAQYAELLENEGQAEIDTLQPIATLSDNGSYVQDGEEVDEPVNESCVGTLCQLSTPDLPGLQLVGSDINSWQGQIVYLNFNGGEDVIYNGPVIVGPFDVTVFEATGELAGQEQEIIYQVLADLEQTFAETGIIFTTSLPAQGTEYSTIYIGGDDSEFAEYGSFNGLAEQVDVGNLNKCDEAFVFTDGLSAQQIVSVVRHELGHLLGYKHDGQTNDTEPNSLLDVADVTVALDNTTTSLSKYTDTSSPIKVADIVVGGDSETYEMSLSGADASMFEIDTDNMELYLKAGVTLVDKINLVSYLTSDSNCVAYWRFEDGGLGTDSVGDNTLSMWGPEADTSDFIEGEASAEFASITSYDRFYCTDGNLSADFPLKSDGTYKDITTIQWIKFSELGPNAEEPGHNQNTFLEKHRDNNISYRLQAVYDAGEDASKIRLSIGYEGDWKEESAVFSTPVETDRWYFVASTFDYETRSYRVQVYDYTAGNFIADDLVGTFDNDITVGDGNFYLGYPSTNYHFDGLMDACIIFNRVLSVEELENIRLGMFGFLDVTVEVDDTTGEPTPDDMASLLITITDENDPPAVSLENTITSLPEDTDTTSRIKVADIVVTDDALGTNSLSLSGDDAALFEIDGTELYLIAGASLDYETNPVLDVTVEVDDVAVGPSPDDTALLSITITDVNDPPAVSLENTTTVLLEDTDTTVRIKVADIVITDDTSGTYDLSLSGDDAAMFEIDGTELYLIAGASLNSETNPVLDVTVEVDDATVGTDPDDTAPLSITITDVNGLPTVSLENTTTSLPEDTDTTSRIKVADIVVTDDALGTNNLSLSGDDAAQFEIDGAELYLIAGASLDYETNPVLDVTVEVDDTTVGSTPDDTAPLSITITDVDDEAPVVISLYPEDDAIGVALDSNLVITFDEDIQKGTGNIVIRKSSDDSIVETIDVSNAQVTVSGAQATIELSSDLEIETAYYIQIDNGAFEDLNNNAYTGISDATTWNFTTFSLWTVLTYDDFESGFGNYTDGGIDCDLYTDRTYAHQGNNAANIQDNNGTSSSFYHTADINVAGPGYDQIEVDFWFYAKSLEIGEDFLVQYYDGTSWQTLATYVSGTDFANGQFYHETLYVDEGTYTFPVDMKIRFMCDASTDLDDVYIDEVKVSARLGLPDTTAPSPDPMTWATAPHATGDTSIAMVATTASDSSGVEYYFACTAGGGHDSGWQDSPIYEDTGLVAETEYTYQVAARDKSPDQNQTAYSSAESATTEAPSAWIELTYDDFESGFGNYTDGGLDCGLYTDGIYAHQGNNAANIQDNNGTSSSFYHTADINVAGPGYDQIEVDFWFYAKSLEIGEDFLIQYYDGTSWQTLATYVSGTDFANGQFYHETLYVDEGTYTFPVDMKIRFMCDASSDLDDVYIDEVRVSARLGEPDTTVPSPDPMTWETVPYATGDTSIAMVATTASDSSGVEYYFACTAGGGHDSGWQDSPVYEDTGLENETEYTYQVMARDGSPNHNQTAYSNAESATTGTDVSFDAVANGEIAYSGTVTGDYTDTHISDGIYESIQEDLRGIGRRRRSFLYHKWTIDVTGSGTVTFYVEAHHTANSENDNFIFSYSTDDSTYTDMLTVTKTSDDDTYQSYELPSDISGTVYIRVMDNDQTAGNSGLDTIYVDHMYIRSSSS
jgi:hypothetical protein